MVAFVLPDEYAELRASVRRLAEEQIAPNAAEADENEAYPWASWNAWHDAGFAGLAFPETYGGQGGGILAHAIAVEEVARVCASSSLFTFISKLAMTPVLDHGSDVLKQKYVTRVAAGSRAAQNGLKQGDLIVAVGQVQISGLADLTSLAEKHPRQLQLAVVRDRNLEFLSMQ